MSFDRALRYSFRRMNLEQKASFIQENKNELSTQENGDDGIDQRRCSADQRDREKREPGINH